MSKRGFTLIELVMVIVLLAILGVASYVATNYFYPIKLKTVAKKVASDIRYVQSLAMVSSEAYGIAFNMNPVNSYIVYKGTSATPITDPLNPSKNYVVDFMSTNTDQYKGVEIIGAYFDGTQEIRFNSYGTPQNSLGNDLVNNGKVTLWLRGEYASVEVTAGSGKVRAQ
jgi:prepilin-type N-terminal cleavage/methylation domain-containing protein